MKQFEVAATYAGLRDFQGSQAVSLYCLLLIPGLGPLRKRFGGSGLTEAGYCLFDKILEVVKHNLILIWKAQYIRYFTLKKIIKNI